VSIEDNALGLAPQVVVPGPARDGDDIDTARAIQHGAQRRPAPPLSRTLVPTRPLSLGRSKCERSLSEKIRKAREVRAEDTQDDKDTDALNPHSRHQMPPRHHESTVGPCHDHPDPNHHGGAKGAILPLCFDQHDDGQDADEETSTSLTDTDTDTDGSSDDSDTTDSSDGGRAKLLHRLHPSLVAASHTAQPLVRKRVPRMPHQGFHVSRLIALAQPHRSGGGAAELRARKQWCKGWLTVLFISVSVDALVAAKGRITHVDRHKARYHRVSAHAQTLLAQAAIDRELSLRSRAELLVRRWATACISRLRREKILRQRTQAATQVLEFLSDCYSLAFSDWPRVSGCARRPGSPRYLCC